MKYTIILILSALGFGVNAQDTLVLNDGKKMPVKVIELAEDGYHIEINGRQSTIMKGLVKEWVKPPSGDWQIMDSEDEMTGKVSRFAVLVSNNVVEFDPPYDGGSTGMIMLNDNGSAILTISNGQFMITSEYATWRFKFDNDAPINMIVRPSRERSDAVIINNSPRFINNVFNKPLCYNINVYISVSYHTNIVRTSGQRFF